ncbi:DEAD/DEAH box helicase [Leptolyngbya sp. AN02str]
MHSVAVDPALADAPWPLSQTGAFVLWGEVWRRVEPMSQLPDEVQPLPYAMAQPELMEWLRSLHHAHQIQWSVADVPLEAPTAAQANQRGKTATLERKAEPANASSAIQRWIALPFAVPTTRIEGKRRTKKVTLLPHYSVRLADEEADEHPVELRPWQVNCMVLQPLEAIALLNSLPLAVGSEADSFMGSDLRFWSHAARWSLDLIARSRFLPGLREHESAAHSIWQVLLDSSTDQERLQQFVKQMPPACCAYGAIAQPDLAAPLMPARTLLLDFLNTSVDAQVRGAIANQSLPKLPLSQESVLLAWLHHLETDSAIAAEPLLIERLTSLIDQWQAPFQRQLSQQFNSFRTCLILNPPLPNQTNWQLEFGLQANDDPDVVVKAHTLWQNPVEQLTVQGRTIEQPQETLLAGLGLASRLYPMLESSLEVQQPETCAIDPLQVYDFIKSTASRLRDSGIGVVLPPSLATEGGWATRLGLSIQAEPPKSTKGLGLKSLLNFRWELTIGGQRLSKAEFNRLVKLNTPLVNINGEWVELRSQDIKAAQAFFETRKDQMSLSLEDALRISTGDTQTIEKLPVLSFEASGALQDLIQALTQGNQSIEPLSTPHGFTGELRPYQQRGAAWMSFLQQWGLGACLADDMGLGKTVQFIALMLHLQEQEALEKPILLVCPTSVLGNWEREVKRFGPSLRVLVHHGDKRSQGKAFAKVAKSVDLLITSYALVYRDEESLKSVGWQGIVLDEAQNIKNPEARQSQVVRQLEADFRIALTGTPVENRLSELWSIMDFLNPGYLGPRNFFQRRFAMPIERYGDTASLKTLRSLVQPFILRRLKTDRTIIQDLPEKQEMSVFCGLTADQAAIYQGLVDQALEDIEAAEGIQRRGKILALLTRLKQVCNHPDLVGIASDEDEDSSADSPSPKASKKGKRDKQNLADVLAQPAAFLAKSGKLQRLTEMLEEVLSEGDRTLVFTQFATWGTWMQTYLQQQFGREVLFLYGNTSQKQREEMVDRFQNDPQGPRIFILSLKAGGVGLNLTRANHVFHFDRWWNPAVENQATDRAFRIGQTRNVQVHKFVCTGTLEERINELIESKKALAENIVGTGENWLTELDTEALRDLLLLDRAAVIDDSP